MKLETGFARDMESIMQKHRYTTKTEFIRQAIREKMRMLEREEALLQLKQIRGASTRKTTDARLRKARELASDELEH